MSDISKEILGDYINEQQFVNPNEVLAVINLSQCLAKTPRGNPNGVDIIDYELYRVAHLTKII